MLYFVQMNNEKQRRCTTILLADARGLEDQAAFSHFLPTVNTERQRDIGCKRFDEEKVLSLAGGLLLAGTAGNITLLLVSLWLLTACMKECFMHKHKIKK